MHLLPLLIGYMLSLICYASAVDPKFDPYTRMRLILVPADANVGSVIYRVRATDEEFDYPLVFELLGDSSSSTVQVESLPCTKYNSVCQANVVLMRRLEPGRYYDFQISVKDTRGGIATQSCSITATNFTTPHDIIFPHKPGIIMIPEDAKRGTELDYVVARKNPLFPKHVYLELWGSPLFAIRQKIVPPEMTEGTIFLLGPLDFEKQSMYHLTVLANDPYAEPGQDTRNIAGLELVIIVEDVQDVPPIFTIAPPVTRLPKELIPGDKIIQIQAEDGDKGVPRQIRYGLVSEGHPLTSFFSINETSGIITLTKPLEEISSITHVGDPVLLTVIAEEVKVMRDEPPAMATTAQLAFILPQRENAPPYFENDHYVTHIKENAPQGTALIFIDPYLPRIYDDDSGKNGVFSLTLLNNNGTFEISPNVAERKANFLIRVRDNKILDYEKTHSLQFQILAQELDPTTNLSTIVNVTVYIMDDNDNPPVFTEPMYMAELPENVTVGTKVIEVHADDVDTGSGGKVRYTQILGYLNTSLNLDAESGLITISTENHGFDRELMPEFHFYVEARDDDGRGNRAQAPFILKLIDVNDEIPIFEKRIYEFTLSNDMRSFTTPAFIKAIDADAEPPNNIVRYEIINGNYENHFKLNEITGELNFRIPLPRYGASSEPLDKYELTVRAFDLGVPVQWSTTIIRIYSPESKRRTMVFLLPDRNPDQQKTEETLSAITGGRVSIHSIQPYTGNEMNLASINGDTNKHKSVVTASVVYDNNSIVDISKIQKRLSESNITAGIINYGDTEYTNTQKAENRYLFWILILLALLIAILLLTLMFCFICSWCPLAGFSKKKVIRVSSTEDDVHLMHKGNTKETKSVQVAEWMGRREAWSASKSADSRTKATRWEFSRRHHSPEKVDIDTHVKASQRDVRPRSSEEQRTVKLKSVEEDVRPSNRKRDQYMESAMRDQDYNHMVHKEMLQNQIDDDSMRRHEIDRGSDIEYNIRENMKYDMSHENDPREQYFIKDGNAEILRLVTRGKGNVENIYGNLSHRQMESSQNQPPQLIVVDNGGGGKEILMRRYIEEQSNGKQIIREHYQVMPESNFVQSLPNEVIQHNIQKASHEQAAAQMDGGSVMMEKEEQIMHATSHHSLIQQELENSLKQQNALLRQILLEKEKLEAKYSMQEAALETQSLPCNSMTIATQTNCNTATQTEPEFKKEHRRRTKSENDDSLSDDDYEYVRYNSPDSPQKVYWMKSKTDKKRAKKQSKLANQKRNVIMVNYIKRNIQTPIQEETEESKSPQQAKECKCNVKSKSKSIVVSPLNKSLLLEISESLDGEVIVPSAKGSITVKSKSVSKGKSDGKSDDDFLENGIVLYQYSAESLDENSDVEEKDTSRYHESQSDHQNDTSKSKKGTRTNRIQKSSLSKTSSTTRISRECNSRESPTKQNRRQTESEPPQTRRPKNAVPKNSERKRNVQKSMGEGSKTLSETDILRKVSDEADSKPMSKYMDWYYNRDNKDDSGRKIQSKKIPNDSQKYKSSPSTARSSKVPHLGGKQEHAQQSTAQMLKEDINKAKSLVQKNQKDGNYSLLQHSEHRFEHEYNPTTSILAPPTQLKHYLYPNTPPNISTELQDKAGDLESNYLSAKNTEAKDSKGKQFGMEESKQLNVATLEDDHDSGIAMNSFLNSMGRKNPIADKKSVFAIAYDEVKVSKLVSESESSPIS
ncbi:cadherin-86C isoform X1 [Lutzomyia longipalpis]|uniref:cadherin-86C isoform X1 n=1 Tax=Lutzomyia longipalpis TaxID=7200 RepID=UPI002483D541|nr:cadherin-86C isoform X1 [Lutzomyia longipalpis]XP_055696680.1 cadherin-86C isoform X1 [Lutzomyia longipalpis]XP_055696681.1 cadherin-86C isoform X1 [Lutzomyia longipalpis]